jgi:hypothetical protein
MTKEIGTTTSTAERASGDDMARPASISLTFSTTIGSTMKALLATKAVTSASWPTVTTSR